jgi:hypothetical protein
MEPQNMPIDQTFKYFTFVCLGTAWLLSVIIDVLVLLFDTNIALLLKGLTVILYGLNYTSSLKTCVCTYFKARKEDLKQT